MVESPARAICAGAVSREAPPAQAALVVAIVVGARPEGRRQASRSLRARRPICVTAYRLVMPGRRDGLRAARRPFETGLAGLTGFAAVDFAAAAFAVCWAPLRAATGPRLAVSFVVGDGFFARPEEVAAGDGFVARLAGFVVDDGLVTRLAGFIANVGWARGSS